MGHQQCVHTSDNPSLLPPETCCGSYDCAPITDNKDPSHPTCYISDSKSVGGTTVSFMRGKCHPSGSGNGECVQPHQQCVHTSDNPSLLPPETCCGSYDCAPITDNKDPSHPTRYISDSKSVGDTMVSFMRGKCHPSGSGNGECVQPHQQCVHT